MSYSVGDKFVLEIKEIDNLKNHMVLENTAVGTDMLDKLERLDSDYINEHFGELQDEAYKAGRDAGIKETLEWNKGNDDDMYNKGLEDAWELVRKIFTFNNGKMEQIFGYAGKRNVFDDLTPQKALAKLKAYEKKQNEIKVGDEVTVFPKSGGQFNAIVILVRVSDRIDVIYNDGITACEVPPELYKKTGKHIDIQSVLQQIGGAE